VLQLRVSGDVQTMVTVARHLRDVPGSRNVHRTLDADTPTALVIADLETDAADGALAAIARLDVPRESVVLLRLEAIGSGAGATRLPSVVWADLLGQAGINARPIARYLILMAVAGVIAAFGVIQVNSILIVGAMAVSPDMLPITATCTGLVLRRWRLTGRALATLVVGLAVACVVAAGLTAALDVVDLLPDGFQIGEGVLQGLSTVNVATVIVAFVAGIAGILALETRASAAVGVAISVTTIPASAYLGVAIGVGEVTRALGALEVLAVNVAMIIIGGCGTLALQRRLARRPARSSPAA
jgi:uncharacterized hydrophobic protein (TIGR00271 family)